MVYLKITNSPKLNPCQYFQLYSMLCVCMLCMCIIFLASEVKEKLNTTFTIETLEEDMEDAHAVLSESINMTPAKAGTLNAL